MGYLAGKRKPRIGTHKEETCQQGISCSINEESESLSESPSTFELANVNIRVGESGEVKTRLLS